MPLDHTLNHLQQRHDEFGLRGEQHRQLDWGINFRF
jgi:hypothetical protein